MLDFCRRKIRLNLQTSDFPQIASLGDGAHHGSNGKNMMWHHSLDERRFYRKLITKAYNRFDQHLAVQDTVK